MVRLSCTMKQASRTWCLSSRPITWTATFRPSVGRGLQWNSESWFGQAGGAHAKSISARHRRMRSLFRLIEFSQTMSSQLCASKMCRCSKYSSASDGVVDISVICFYVYTNTMYIMQCVLDMYMTHRVVMWLLLCVCFQSLLICICHLPFVFYLSV